MYVKKPDNIDNLLPVKVCLWLQCVCMIRSDPHIVIVNLFIGPPSPVITRAEKIQFQLWPPPATTTTIIKQPTAHC